MKIEKKFLAVITTLGILITGMGINSSQPVHAAESDVVKTIEIKHIHSGIDDMGGCYSEIKCGEVLTKKVTETKCWTTTTLTGYGTLYDGYGNPKSEQGYTQRKCPIHGVVEQNTIVGFTTTGYCPAVIGTKTTYYCATHNDQEYTESGTCQTVTGHQLTCEDTTNTVIARITLNKSYDVNDRYLITPVLTYSSPKYTNAVYTWDDTDEEVLNVTGNGNHILKIAYRDSGSDREKEIAVTVSDYDTEAPIITDLTQSPATPTKGPVTITVTATDNYKVKYYRMGLNTWVTSNTFEVTENGTYYFSAKDPFENVSKNKSIVISNIDKEKPVITITDQPTEWTNEGVTVKFSVTDNMSPGTKIKTMVSQNQTEETITGNSQEYTATENGVYYIHAEDEAGNIATESFTVKNIDRKPPKLKIKEIDRSWTKESVIITFSATDDSNDTLYYTVSKNPDLTKTDITGTDTSATVTENGTYYVYACDKAGNIAKESVTITQIDNTPPVITIHPYNTNWTKESVIITFSATDDSNDTLYYAFTQNANLGPDDINSTSTSGTVTENGTYYIYAKDKAGNIAKESVVIENIDRIPPVITVNPFGEQWTKESVIITFSATDNSNDTLYYAFSESGNLTPADITGSETTATVTENGTYYVYAKDKAGNIAKKTVVVSNIDREAPVITINPYNTAWTKESVTITFSATDNSNDTIYYAFSKTDSLTESSITGSETTATVTENGTYYIYACDKAGNVAKESVTITNIDKEAPVITVEEISNEYTKDDIIIRWSATDDCSTVIYYAFSKNSVLEDSLVNESIKSATVSENDVYYIYAKDEAGNVAKKSVTIKNIDKVPPVISVELKNGKTFTDADEKIWTDKVTAIVTATDNVGLHASPYKYSEEEGFVVQAKHEFSKNGSFTITVRDKVGNENTENITIDNIDEYEPLLDSVFMRYKNANKEVVEVPISTSLTDVNMISLVINAHDEQSAVDSYRLKNIFNEYTTWQTSNVFPNIYLNGTYTVEIKDKCGNIKSENITITCLSEKFEVKYLDLYGEKVLGERIMMLPIGTAISGADLGIDTTTGAYYPGYTYVSCDTAIVTTGENVVHRFFKLNTCTVIFHDADGEVLYKDTVIWGEACGYNNTPDKETIEKDGYEYSYSFEKWVTEKGADVNLLNITENLSLYPKFTEFKKEITYTIRFVVNNYTLAIVYAVKGTSVNAPKAPAIEGSVFAGWDKDLTNIQSNMTVNALYKKTNFGGRTDVVEEDVHVPPVVDFSKFVQPEDVEYIVQDYQKKEEVKKSEDEHKKEVVIPEKTQIKKQTVAQSINRLYTDEKTKTAAITTTVVLGTASLWLIISYILYAIGGLTLLQLFLFWLALLFKRRRYIAGAWLTEDANTRYVDRYGRRVVMEETGDGRLQFRRGKKILRTIVVDKLLDDLNAGKITYSEFENIIKASQVYTSFSKNLEIEVSSAKSRRRAETRKVSGFSLTKCIKSALDVADEYRVRIKNGAESILFDLKYSDPL